MNFEKKYYKYKKKYTESKNNMKSLIGGSKPFYVFTGKDMKSNNEILYYNTNDGVVLHTSNTNGPIEIKKSGTNFQSTDLKHILRHTIYFYKNGIEIFAHNSLEKFNENFSELLNNDIIKSIEIKPEWEGEYGYKSTGNSLIGSEISQPKELKDFFIKLKIIIKLNQQLSEPNLEQPNSKGWYVSDKGTLKDNNTLIESERYVGLDLFGKTLFVEEKSNSSKINETLQDINTNLSLLAKQL